MLFTSGGLVLDAINFQPFRCKFETSVIHFGLCSHVVSFEARLKTNVYSSMPSNLTLQRGKVNTKKSHNISTGQ